MVATTVLDRRERAARGPDELVSSVHEMMRSVVRRLQPALANEGISTGQFWALHLVSSLQSASLSTVARHLAVSAPTVCSNVDLLEAEGLVTRHRSDEDRREVELMLTPKGRRAEARIWGQIGRFMNEAAQGLPAHDIATSVRVFRELHRRLDLGEKRSGGTP
jgi:DNA-binding MarR family transcriptional regulator